MDNSLKSNKTLYLVALMAIWIAYFEGFFKPGSIPSKNNNPGDLRSWGSNPIQNGYAYFDTVRNGWIALITEIWDNIDRNLTLYEFFAGKPGVYPGYAPAPENNPLEYARFISDHTGIPLDYVTIKTFFELINLNTSFTGL